MRQQTNSLLILLLFSGLLSCTNSSSIQENPGEKAKSLYTIYLNMSYRRTSESYTWKNIANQAEVHAEKHKLIPAFRLFSVQLNVLDSSYEFALQGASLKSYCKDSLVETNMLRTFGESYRYLYSGKNGLLNCTDWETLSFNVYYRKAGDTLSAFSVDSLRYKIILDRDQ
jgi:hypothetical protein